MCFRFQAEPEVFRCGSGEENRSFPRGGSFLDTGLIAFRTDSLNDGHNANGVGTVELVALELTSQAKGISA